MPCLKNFVYTGYENIGVITRVQQCDTLRLLISTILRCKPPFVITFGLVCSSFIAVSRGSARRHFFWPLGDETSSAVQLGNLLASRTRI